MQGQQEGLVTIGSESGVCQQCRLSRVRPLEGSSAHSTLHHVTAFCTGVLFLSTLPTLPHAQSSLQVRCDRIIPCPRYDSPQMGLVVFDLTFGGRTYVPRPHFQNSTTNTCMCCVKTWSNSDQLGFTSLSYIQMSAHGFGVRAAISRTWPASRDQVRYGVAETRLCGQSVRLKIANPCVVRIFTLQTHAD